MVSSVRAERDDRRARKLTRKYTVVSLIEREIFSILQWDFNREILTCTASTNLRSVQRRLKYRINPKSVDECLGYLWKRTLGLRQVYSKRNEEVDLDNEGTLCF